MAKEYKDQILDTSVNEKRVYNIVDSDGNIVAENVSFEDKTVYLQDGTEFGAQEVNEIYDAIDEVNQSLYNLDYDNMELVSFRATGDTYTVPKNGILTGTWRSSLSADGTVGILSDKRQNDYIHLESKPAGQYYTHFEYIVNIGEILTCKYFQNVDSAVVGYFIPFK